MLASVIVLIIIGVITYYQVFKQGLFSAMIMAVLSVVAALTALNFFEALGQWLASLGLAAWCPRTLSLMAVFIITLLILRLLTDRFIPGNMHFPMIIDRAGSAFFGLITGITTAGIIVMGFQLLPISPDILGFNRYQEEGKYTSGDESELFPNADGFVLTLMECASTYSLAGERSFAQIHPDMQTEAYLNRLVLDASSRREAAPGAVRVNRVFVTGEVMDLHTGQLLSPDRDEAFLGVTISIMGGSDSKDNRGARDPDGKIRFVLGNLRLTGFDPERHTGEGIHRYPAGLLLPGGKIARSLSLSEGKTFDGDQATVTLLYSWPDPHKNLPPQFLEFKGTARAEVPMVADTFDPDAAAAGAVAQGATSGKLTLLSGASALVCEEMNLTDGQNLPLACTNSLLSDSEAKITGEVPRSGTGGIALGHVLVQFDKRRDIKDDGVSVTLPEGFALIVVSAKGNSLQSNSLTTPVLVDSMNREYVHCGLALIGSVGGKDTLEFAYSMYDDQSRVLRPDQPRAVPFPREFMLKGQNATVTRAKFLYLVPQQNPPVGLVGCRSRPARNDAGTFWGFSNIEMIVIPPR